MRLFGYPYNDLVICKDSPDYLCKDSNDYLAKVKLFLMTKEIIEILRL